MAAITHHAYFISAVAALIEDDKQFNEYMLARLKDHTSFVVDGPTNTWGLYFRHLLSPFALGAFVTTIDIGTWKLTFTAQDGAWAYTFTLPHWLRHHALECRREGFSGTPGQYQYSPIHMAAAAKFWSFYFNDESRYDDGPDYVEY